MTAFRILGLAAVLSASAAAMAGDGSERAKTKAPEERKICIRQADTGSIRVRRVCYTQAQMEAMQSEADKKIDQSQQRGSAGVGF